jgi:hypothetical protein
MSGHQRPVLLGTAHLRKKSDWEQEEKQLPVNKGVDKVAVGY